MLARLLSFVGFAAAGLAQNTWIVDAAGGPGVSFPDLPSAVGSASVVDGDTILVRTGPFGEGAAPFTTGKGLTIVGVGGQVPITTSPASPIAIVGVPAGRTFRLVGFARSSDGAVDVRVQNCAGDVHLESLTAREPDALFPTGASIAVDNCASVMLRGLVNFGAPAVSVQASTVALVACQLGVTAIGLGGGQALAATGSTVDVVEPRFDPAWGSVAIQSTSSTLRIAGDGAALIRGRATAPGTAAIVANGGAVTIDPAVPLTMTPPAAPPVLGTAAVLFAAVPASWTLDAARPAQPLSIRTTAPAGAAVFQALGAPGPLAATPFGVLGLDPLAPYAFFPVVVVPGTGVVTNVVTVPAAMPLGATFASQAVVWDGSQLRFGAPVSFTAQ